jgi:cell wall-associated NlpC family hydrolase
MKQIAIALIAASLLSLAPGIRAQESYDQSLARTATTRMKDAAAAAWQSAQELSAFALGLIGVDYKYGGTSPETGLDCSGLVRYVFQQVTGITLPRTAKEMSRVGDKVALSDLKPGDLVFFNTRRFDFSHVGIYLGDNQFIHAPSRGREVEVTTLDKSFWQKRFNGARRLVHAVPDLMPSIVSEAVAAPLDVIAAEAAAAADTQP